MTPLSDDDLRALVSKIQAGKDLDESARKLHERFRPAIVRMFEKYGFSREESRDLTQDVFVRVFKSIGEFRGGDAKFESWIFEIAANIYKNEIRRRRTGKRLGQEVSLDAAADPEVPVGGIELRSNDPDALAELEKREQSEKLRVAIAKLPAQMRQCCELRYVQGLKYQEIALLMKISIDTVKAHLHQARKRLKAALDTDPEG